MDKSVFNGPPLETITPLLVGSADATQTVDRTSALDSDGPQRLVVQVAKAIQASVDRRQTTMDLRLQPPELGVLRIHMEVKNNVLTAFLQTDNAQARELLTQQLTELRNILEGQGVQVGRLDVQLRLEPGEANAENPDPQDDPGRRSADDPRQEQPSNETEADEVPIDDLEEPLEQDWAQGQGVDLALDRIA